jgi:EmrB/QacA subfamily drug resistance transporter
MLFLDDTIVNVALPSISSDLGIDEKDLTWVVNGYVLMFGGFLLLGGRLADLVGRRRMFLIGLALFGLASFGNTLADSTAALVATRACQGLGSALTAPAAFSLVALLFSDDDEQRTKVFALWNAIAGLGAAAGVVLSGIITDLSDWRWIFYINVPVALGAFVAISRLLEPQPGVRRRDFDLTGAVVATAGIVLLVYTILETEGHGWLAGRSIGGFVGAALLLSGFVAIERRVSRPLVRLSFFTDRRRNTAVGMQYLLAAVLFGAFFLTTLYMQQRLGYSPLQGGLAWLTFFVTLFVAFGVAPQLTLRYGVRPVLVAGLLLGAAGLVWFAQTPVHGSYWSDLAPAMALLGLGLGTGYVPVTVAALAGTREDEAGLATALLSSGQQIGGALGLAILVALATTRAHDLAAGGQSIGAAAVHGAHVAYWVGAGMCVGGALVTIALIGAYRPETIPTPTAPLADESAPGDEPSRPAAAPQHSVAG